MTVLYALDLFGKHVVGVFATNLQESLTFAGLLLFQGELYFDAHPLFQFDDGLWVGSSYLYPWQQRCIFR